MGRHDQRGHRCQQRTRNHIYVHWVLAPHGRGASDYNLNDGLLLLQVQILASEHAHPEMRGGPLSPRGVEWHH